MFSIDELKIMFDDMENNFNEKCKQSVEEKISQTQQFIRKYCYNNRTHIMYMSYNYPTALRWCRNHGGKG